MSVVAGCQSLGSTSHQGLAQAEAPSVRTDLPVAQPPFHQVEVNWKQRLPVAYLYLESRGSYTQIGAVLEELHARMTELGVAPAGPPFGLYYDDPGRVAARDLRMRACYPVEGDARPPAPLARDVLPSTTVAYAFVGGAYPEVPRCYPALYGFMSELGWVENGPVREIYLVNPATVASYDALVTEVQIPATSSR
jgi:effector-binding domain-containing protein